MTVVGLGRVFKHRGLIGLVCLFLFIPGRSNGETGQDSFKSTMNMTEKWTGDFDVMAQKRVIRALVVNSKTFYFIDAGRQRGLSYDSLMAFETYINRKLNNKSIKIHVIVIPVARDNLLPYLVNGLGDIAVANLTITPMRSRFVDFSRPELQNVAELVVSGPSAPKLDTLEDLAGKEVYARKSSSYYESLLIINQFFLAINKPQIDIRVADENLEDEDLLEMVNAGLIPAVVVDSHKAFFWKQIFNAIIVHDRIVLRSGGNIGWAFRKHSPKMKKMVDGFIEKHKKGTLFGNIVFKRYLQNTKYVENSLSKKEIGKFNETSRFFKKYAGRYAFDWLMIAAQGYQESHLDHTKRSSAGAVGIMQILPSTAADKNVNIKNIEKLGNNIHAGAKYLRFIVDRYFKHAQMDILNQTLFGFASYNAGPARVARLRREAKRMGLDPNVWFNNVEIVAAKRIGQETVQYVSNIFKYWVAYRLVAERQTEKANAAVLPR